VSAKAAPQEARSNKQKGLLLALAKFGGTAPKPARAELLMPSPDGTFRVEGFDDPESNVFHKAMLLTHHGQQELITIGGMKAAVKSWQRASGEIAGETLWSAAFGGKFDRMRDAEVGDVTGDSVPEIVVGTHDQGVVVYLAREGEKWVVHELDKQKDTFVHEIELGDLNGDGVTEIYATLSAPNRLDGGEQPGMVVRYTPSKGGAREVVADLGKRHAKEIAIADMDGDGRAELYVAVEALTSDDGGAVKIIEPVEIRRYDAGTAPDKGRVVARIDDRYCRFLTVGDVDGDGKKEMVAAAFRSGVWLLRSGSGSSDPWEVTNIEAQSSGFEHAALLTDLDGDGKDELYVAADDQGELRRYVWRNATPDRDTLLKRDNPKETWTWNIMPLPAGFELPVSVKSPLKQ
jgi:hypothetical protein